MENPYASPQPRPLTPEQLNALAALVQEINQRGKHGLFDSTDQLLDSKASRYTSAILKACIAQKDILNYEAALLLIKKKQSIPDNLMTRMTDVLTGRPSNVYFFDESAFTLAWNWIQNRLSQILGNA